MVDADLPKTKGGPQYFNLKTLPGRAARSTTYLWTFRKKACVPKSILPTLEPQSMQVAMNTFPIQIRRVFPERFIDAIEPLSLWSTQCHGMHAKPKYSLSPGFLTETRVYRCIWLYCWPRASSRYRGCSFYAHFLGPPSGPSALHAWRGKNIATQGI